MGWNDLIGTPFGDEEHQYIVEAEIARGGMSRVFRAHEVVGDRVVALKVMALGSEGGGDTRTFTRRFEHEARAVERLDHPNIVKVFNTGRTDDFVYIAMQLVLGGTYRQRLGRPMPIADACAQMIQMAKALHHAHMHHIIHRDVKPANMLIDDRDPSHLLLADFGIAKIIGQKGVTKTGTAVGTPEYMAPEQAKGEEIDQRADIYGLACVLYESLAGRPPFVGPTALSICYQHVHTRPAYIRGFNPEVPRGLALVIEQALAKNPRDRYATAEDFANALYPFTESVGRGARPSTPLVDLNVHMPSEEDDPELEESSSERTNDVDAFSLPNSAAMDISRATVPLADVSAMLDLSGLGTRHTSSMHAPEEDATMRQTQEMTPVSQPARPRHTRPVQPGLRLKSRPITRPRDSESGSYPMFDATDPSRLSTIQTPVTPLPQAKIALDRSPNSSFSERFPQPSRQRMIILVGVALVVTLLSLLLISHLRPTPGGSSTSLVVVPTNTTIVTQVATTAPTQVPTTVPTQQPTQLAGGPTPTPPSNIKSIMYAADATTTPDTQCITPTRTAFAVGETFTVNVCVNPGYGNATINYLLYWDKQPGQTNATGRQNSDGSKAGFYFSVGPLKAGKYHAVFTWNGSVGQNLYFTVS